MNKASHEFSLPASIKKAAERLAKQDGVSLNDWIAIAVAQKISAVETTDAFFDRLAAGHSVEDLRRALARVPNNPPDPGDEIE